MKITVVIPFCKADQQKTLTLAEWIAELGGCKENNSLMIAASDVTETNLTKLFDRKSFKTGTIIKPSFALPNEAHPRGPNWMFETACKWIQLNSKEPWLWLEPDAVPMRPNWLQMIEAEYELALKYKKKILAHVVDWPNATPSKTPSGVAVYPPDAWDIYRKLSLNRNIAWDIQFADKVMPLVHSSRSIANLVNRKNPPTFAGPKALKVEGIPSYVAVWHQCKDDSLIDALRAKQSGDLKIDAKPKSGTPILPIRCRLDDHTGYGQVGTELIMHLLDLEKTENFRLEITPVVTSFRYGKMPVKIQNRIKKTAQESSWELLLYTLVVAGTQPKPNSVFFTMWESSRVPDFALDTLNKCSHVIVPNHWFASCLTAQGLERPIHMVPLGIETSKFPDRDMPSLPFTIGTAGRFDHGGIRKGVALVYEAFKLAFKADENVYLRIKCSEDDDLEKIEDGRVDIVRDHLTTKQMSDWYSSLHVFASGSACEGWGRHQQEAMATGRPVIGVNFGGITEFWNPTNGYAVEYNIHEGTGVYKGNGCFAWPKVESMAQAMMAAFKDAEALKEKSKLSFESVKAFTSRNMAEKLVKLLKELRYI